ncbi:MAG TPA: TonB-dependent receptor [Puia sp.]
MKLTFIFLTIVLLHAHATGLSQTVTLSGKNMPLTKVFSEIKKQTGYFFFFNNKLLKDAKPVTLNVKDRDLKEVLEICLRDQPLDYVIESKTVAIIPKIQPVEAAPAEVPADTLRDVRGRVINSKGEPVSNASVIVKGTTISTAAHADGTFSLKMPVGKHELIISSIGYQNMEAAVGSSGQVLVTMMEKTLAAGDDMVVIGYGVAKKSDLTGSVSTVNIKDIGDRQNPDLATLLQGKVAGVDVNGGSIRIRGVTSFNNTDPLVVVDGFLGETMNTVNPNDIQNIEVLKDASSTAIYGSRGANGVILITTKKGRLGDAKVNINYNSGLATTPKKLPVLNASQYIDFVTEGLKNAGQALTPKLSSPDVRKDVTNWQDEVFRVAHSNSIDVNLSGGTVKSTYYVSFGYKAGDDIVIGPKYKMFTSRFKNDFTLRSWLKVGTNLALTYRRDEGARPLQGQYMINMPPYIPVRDTSNYWGYGTINRQTDLGDNVNPVASSALTHPVTTELDYQGNIWAEISPLKGLVYHVQAGVSGFWNRGTIWNDQYNDGAGQTVVNNYTDNTNYNYAPIIESYLTYNRRLGKHDVTLMGGNTWQARSENGGIAIQGQNFANTEVRNVFYAATRSITNEAQGTYAAESYFGRLNYSFNNRYLLTVNVRTDGSPRFAPEHRWGTFPSVAVAWKLHEENFIRNLGLFDQLKLHASWGTSGNDAIGDFKYLSQVWTNGVYYPFGTTPTLTQGATVINDASDGIKWESTTSKTAGVDMGFLRNRLNVTAEYFIKNSNDILFAVPRPVSLGYGQGVTDGNAIVNAASCVNKGFELTAEYRDRAGELNYSINANYTHVTNNVTSLGLGQPYLNVVSRTDVNNPIGYFYGYKAVGVFKTQAEVDQANANARAAALKKNPGLSNSDLAQIYYQLPATQAGDEKFKDIDGDGRVTDDKDRTNIGNSIPTNLFGLTVYMDYKGFDMNIFFQGITGSKLFYMGYGQTRGMAAIQNQETYVLNRWHSEQDPGNGIVPRAVMGDPALNNRPSTLQVESGNYLKLRQFSIGYTLPAATTTKIGFTRIRFYLSGSNLLTFTKYSGYDPEYASTNLNRGFQYLDFPPSRNFSFGIQAGL